ncbi:hypothetical protein KY312_03765 [Candidatus Woesearchaeota archaeon]|nr:hypothetical protein [Candidatus Woesearchaeota archaeon]
MGRDKFSLRKEPLEGLTAEEIKSWYLKLHDAIYVYELARNQIGEQRFQKGLKEMVEDILSPYEYQTAHFVVRDFEPEKQFSPAELKLTFLNYLYNNKEKYIFFEDREKTIDKLISLDAIKEFGYKLTQHA